MATIENVGDFEKLRTLIMAQSRAELIAQQMTTRGAIDALQCLIAYGGGLDVAAQMLANVRESLCIVHEVANARGIELVGYR